MLRRRTLARIARFVIVAFVCTQLAACFSEHSDAVAPDDCDIPPGAQGPGRAVVTISSYRFSPDTLRVARGTTITWVNCDRGAGTTDPHTATSDTGVWASPLFALGGTYSRAFTSGGNFPYHCVPHPSMRAVIVVQ